MTVWTMIIQTECKDSVDHDIIHTALKDSVDNDKIQTAFKDSVDNDNSNCIQGQCGP